MKKKIKKSTSVSLVASTPLLTTIKLDQLGSNNDPCFGTLYDLSTSECKLCGDSELCCIKTADHLGKTRKELESVETFKDLDFKYDKQGLKKYYRGLSRKGKSKKEIIECMQTKYEITQKEARTLYREFNK